MSPLRYLLALLPLTWLCGGCLISHSRKRVVREDEVRQQVQFESPYAAETFHAIASSDEARNATGGSSSFGIPFLIGISHASVPSRNAFYNDQVASCDVNGDGFISDREVAAITKR